MRYILSCSLLFLILFAKAQPVDRMTDLRVFQQDVIKVLTGVIPYEGSATLTSRSTPTGRNEAVKIIMKYLNEMGLNPKHHHYTMAHRMIFPDLFFEPAKGTNVYAIHETNPGYEYIVVGAHFDSEPASPGAGDNASGVALVLALAKMLSEVESLPYNYVFVFFDQEEDDEIGSRAFAQFLQKNQMAVHSVHITDLAGWDKDGDGVIIIQTEDQFMKQIYFNGSKQLGILIRSIGGASSDNKSFRSFHKTAGIFGDITKHLHKPSDTYQTVDFEFLEQMTYLMGEVLVTLK